MAKNPLNVALMRKALESLDAKMSAPAHLVIGGGGALALAYQLPLTTSDIDAFTAKGGLTLLELDHASKAVAKELNIASDWLNSHFVTFTHVLPGGYAQRLREVYCGKLLKVDALGPEDLLIMKCFAGREKDRPHVLKLMPMADLTLVDKVLQDLIERRIKDARKAADFFDDLRDEAGL